MGRLFRKTSIAAAILVFIQVVYHLALHVKDGGIAIKAFEYLGRAGWISVDIVLCLAGFFCFRLFSPAAAGAKEWLSKLLAFLRWTAPAYFAFLILYLSVGLRLQHYLGNPFVLRDGYLPSLLLFYSNFLMARGPHSGVALESLFMVCMVLQLTFGVGLALALDKGKKAVPVIVGVLWALSIALRFAFRGANQWFTFFNTFTRMDGFLAGILLAYLDSREGAKKALREKKGLLLGLGAVALVAAAAFTKGLSRYEPMVDAVSNPPVAFFSLALVNFLFNSRLPRGIKRFSGLDRVTFAVYLVKHPVIYMVEATLFLKMGLARSLAANAAFIGIGTVLCYLVGLAWYLAVDRNIDRLAALGRRLASLAAARQGERSL